MKKSLIFLMIKYKSMCFLNYQIGKTIKKFDNTLSS